MSVCIVHVFNLLFSITQFRFILSLGRAKIAIRLRQKKLLLHKSNAYVKIGVLGAGHLGKIHIKCIQQIPTYELVGFYDADPENAKM